MEKREEMTVDRKDIKDYLHLYLGCDGSYDGKTWRLRMVSDKFAYLRRGKDQNDRVTIHLHEAKPILRPLSDMTEEESNFRWDNFGNISVINQQVVAEEIRWLLSKHFDLFGLIENNLAIDKTKLNP